MITEEKGSVLETVHWKYPNEGVSDACLCKSKIWLWWFKNYCPALWNVSRRAVHSWHSALSLGTLHLFAQPSLAGWLVAKCLPPLLVSPLHSRQTQEGKREELSQLYLPLLLRKQRSIFLKPHWPDLGHVASLAAMGILGNQGTGLSPGS